MKNSFKHNFNITLRFIKIIHKISKAYIPLTFLNIILATAVSFVNIIFPKFIIDELLGIQNMTRIIMFVSLIIGINFLFNLFINVINYYVEIQNQQVTAKLGIMLGEKSLELDYNQAEQKENLELKERAMFVIRNQNALKRMMDSVRSVIQNIIIIIGVLAIIATLDFVIIIFIAIVLFFSFKILKKQSQTTFAVTQESIPINRIFNYYSNLTTDFSAGKDIRIYCMQPFILKKIDDFINKNLSNFNKLSKNTAKYQMLGYINLNIENICVYAYMCYKVLINDISIGSFTMGINAVNTFGNAVSGLITQFFEFSNMCQYLNPFFEFLNIKANSIDGTATMSIVPKQFELAFNHVTFIYPHTEKKVLDDVCVTIRSNEKISIVGMNGAGKTTFVKLLTRLYRPTSGEILLNGININEYKYNEYIKFFSAVFQDYKNYAFSIKENITLSQSAQVEDEMIFPLLEELSLNKKISALKNGVNTSLYKIFDNDGIELSGGEMQKIAIARANYKDAPVIILDEPTSSLDPIMEYEIINNFNNMIKHKTAIYISHRLSSCRFSDKILVFENGKITSEGSHSELINDKENLYYKMYNSQAQYYA